MTEQRHVSTKLATHGTGHKQPGIGLSTVNAPVTRGSTLVYDDFAQIDAWRAHTAQSWREGYGRSGSDATHALEGLIAELEGGTDAIATNSGLSAVTIAMGAFVSAGDQLLVADNLYGPGRAFADKVLARFGVTITYFDPLDLAALPALITPQAKALYFEAPGSLTFEVPDCAGLYAIAQAHGLISIIDNTWATALNYPAIARGADVSVAAGTKYYVGHCDAFFGIVVGNERTATRLRKQAALCGNHMGPDDVYLAMRGMRTLKVRMDAIGRSARAVADFLHAHPKVAQVLHPALPSCPGHANWAAQFDGASGLFGLFLDAPYGAEAARAMIERLELFSIGFSWGGFESLAIHAELNTARTASDWQALTAGKGALIRLQIGLEDSEDLIADLTAGLEAMG